MLDIFIDKQSVIVWFVLHALYKRSIFLSVINLFVLLFGSKSFSHYFHYFFISQSLVFKKRFFIVFISGQFGKKWFLMYFWQMFWTTFFDISMFLVFFSI